MPLSSAQLTQTFQPRILAVCACECESAGQKTSVQSKENEEREKKTTGNDSP